MALRVASLNCRGLQNSVVPLNNLLRDGNISIIALQEIWLAKQELDSLQSINELYNGAGVAKIDFTQGHLHGRKSGGVAYLWKELCEAFAIAIVPLGVNWANGLSVVNRNSGTKFFLLMYTCLLIVVTTLMNMWSVFLIYTANY